MKWKMTAHYGLIQGALWGLYVPLFAFGSMYLLAKGLTNTQVGYVIAAGSAASVLIQPMFGSLADRSRKNILHRLITALIVLMVLLSAILLAEGNLPWLSAILFSLLICIIFVITPLTYSLGIFFMERGAEINFGICRGTGSLVYSVISVWMGIAAARTNEDIVVWAIIVLCVLTIGAVCSFHFRGIDEKKKVQDTDGTSSAGGVILF